MIAHAKLALGIGVAMTFLGAYVALRLLIMRLPPVTGSLGLDIAFAVFFLLRGALQIRRARSRPKP